MESSKYKFPENTTITLPTLLQSQIAPEQSLRLHFVTFSHQMYALTINNGSLGQFKDLM